MQLTKKQQKAVEEVHRRMNGWPVGIPMGKAIAAELVGLGLAEYAPPAWLYPAGSGDSIRLTTGGQFHATNPDWCEHYKTLDNVCLRCKQKVYPNPHYRK